MSVCCCGVLASTYIDKLVRVLQSARLLRRASRDTPTAAPAGSVGIDAGASIQADANLFSSLAGEPSAEKRHGLPRAVYDMRASPSQISLPN